MIANQPVIPPSAPAPRERGGQIIAIASGKGGVGKTWLAITLAHAWARAGLRTLLFDGDLGLANVDIQLGLTPEQDLSAVVAGRASLAAATTSYLPGGFDILAGRSGSGSLSALSPEALEAVLAALRIASRRYEAIVLDLGAGLDRAVRRMATFADRLVVVVTDEPTSLTDAYAVLKLFAADHPAGDARVMVNQAASRAAGERTFGTLERAARTFLGRAPQLAGVIRRDEHVRETIRRQTPLLLRHPTAPAAGDVEAASQGLLRTLTH